MHGIERTRENYDKKRRALWRPSFLNGLAELSEANLGYQIMEGIWSGDNDIIELQDLLIS
uniref:Uncharacterized protein n=1 Tax=Thermosporothrix sp. COM3 TaxID=2490863 RepID=A0A455SRB9_9CHLR|nr:hypothetical protein KTC_48610 [Thermosporothrix sp. COM3]BBH90175.1 hypothetical protein KTC_49260 [Thermosporothrix sp. COM3]BBH90240.1 hypothetical protein KTC_49910 [Thermosporothrix sp. COM3]